MPAVGLVYKDTAGGRLLTGSSSVYVNDLPVVVLGSLVEDHGLDEHDNAKMAVGYFGVQFDNKPICTAGMKATCGHPLISNSNVEVG